MQNKENVTRQPVSVSLMGLTSDEAANIVEKCKAVTHAEEGKEAIRTILPYLVNMSSLDENESNFMGREFKDVEIPEFLKDLVMPAKVSIFGKRADKDLLVHPAPVEVGSYKEYCEACEVVSSCIAKRGTEGRTVTLDSLKTLELISNVKNYSQGGSVCLNDITYALPLSIEITKNSVMGVDIAEIAADTFRNAVRKYKA